MTVFIKSYVREKYVIIEPEGRIGGESSIDFYTQVKEVVSEMPDADVIVNFRAVDFIDSSGLGSLVAINSHLVRNGRRLVLAGVMDNLLGLLKITNLFSILKIVDTVDDVFA